MRKVNIRHAVFEFDKNAHYYNQLNKKPDIKQEIRKKIFDLQGQIQPISMAHICDITKYDATDSQKEEVREIFLDNINDLIDLNEAKMFLNYYTKPNEFDREKYGSLNSFLSAALMTVDLFFFIPTTQIPNVRYILNILANEYFSTSYYDSSRFEPTPEMLMKYKYFYVNTIVSYTYEYLKALDQTKYDYIFDYAPKVSTLESMIYLLSIFNDEHDNTSKDGRSSLYEDAYNFINAMYTYLQNSISVIGYDAITYGDTNTSKMQLDVLDRDPGFETAPEYICEVRTFGDRMEELLNIILNNKAYGIYTTPDVAPEDIANQADNTSFESLYENLLNQIVPSRDKKTGETSKSEDDTIDVNKKCCSSDKSACTGQCKNKKTVNANTTSRNDNEQLSNEEDRLLKALNKAGTRLDEFYKKYHTPENYINWTNLEDDTDDYDYLDYLLSLFGYGDADSRFRCNRENCNNENEKLKKQQDESAKQKVQEKDNTVDEDPLYDLKDQVSKLFKTIFPDIQLSDTLKAHDPDQKKPKKPEAHKKPSKSIHDVPVKTYTSYDDAMNDPTLSEEVKNFLHFVETVFK